MKFSIVIPNYNGSKLLHKNLPRVIEASEDTQIIVVDDASSDDSVKMLRNEFPNIEILVNTNNMRFARTCNRGVAAATGDVVVLLNTDVWPEKNFLTPLKIHFNHPSTFAVGCMELVDAGSRGKSTGKFERGLLIHRAAADRDRGPTLWAFGGSAAFSRTKWIALGGMDHLFRPAYWEDIDLSYRAWKRGWQVVFEPESRVHHEPESTNVSAFGRARIRRIASKNQLLFVWKDIHEPALVKQHLVWLPLRLASSFFKGDGAFLWGFIHALRQLPEALQARSVEKKLSTVTDEDVFRRMSSGT